MLYFALFSIFYFIFLIFLFSACFASQTSGLCSAFPSVPVKSVTRFCYPLVRTLFCAFCLTNTGFVQCYSLRSHKVCCMLALYFALFSIFYLFIYFLLCVFCLTNIALVQSSPFGSRGLLHAFVVSNLCFVLFASPTSGLCSAFPFGSPPVYTLLSFFV